MNPTLESQLKAYFEEQNLGTITEISDLHGGNSNNHTNHKIVTTAGTYVARIGKADNASSKLSKTSLSDEYTILKLVEKYDIGPRAIRIELEYFDTHVLIEEFLPGMQFEDLYKNSQPLSEEIFDATIDLIAKTSDIPLNADMYPFKHGYTTFKTNLKQWQNRMREIENAMGKDHPVVIAFHSIVSTAEKILTDRDHLAKGAKKEFIYNDIHAENLFWIADSANQKKGIAKFIDWQKVSLGHPVAMIVVFVRRCSRYWNMNDKDFSQKVIEAYSKQKDIPHIQELFEAAYLERAVSDMTWSLWAEIRTKGSASIEKPEESHLYVEAKALLGVN